MDRVPVHRRILSQQGLVLLGTYAAISLGQLLQSAGRTTFDTKLDLLVDPGRFLSQTLSLWSPHLGMGEVQNQAYGYLFPIGPFFWVGHALAVPPWLTERIWSTALTVIAFEGARRLALAWGGVGWRGALLVGAAFVSAPRFLTTIGALTGEVLPTVVLPWVVLPLVLARRRRLDWLAAMLLSGVALLFAGGQNAVETVAILPLPAVVLVHAVLRGELPRRCLAIWPTAVLAAGTWWLGPLLLLGKYSPPFLDYVESAANTTSELGWVNSVRGADHWVAYVTVGGGPWWPTGYALATTSWLVLATGLVAAVSLAGLVGRGVPDRVCLTVPLGFGLVCLVAAHGGWSGGLFAEQLRSLLDGPLAPLRNVHKVDPLVRLPLALGFGFLAHDARVAVARLLGRRPAWVGRSSVAASVIAGACAFVVLGAAAQPVAAGELRQRPGWSAIPQPWQRAAEAIDALPAGSRVLVLPASGFGQQVWGNTIDEPLQALTDADWTARSQAPLVPGANVRLLDSVEAVVASGHGSLGLAPLLARSGITHLLVRTDLNPDSSDAPSPSVVLRALRGSLGLREAQSFGTPPGAGLPLQLWRVDSGAADPRVTVSPGDPEVVQGGPEALLPLLESGVLPPDRPVVLAGQDGASRVPPEVLTDSLQRREQQFGRVNWATSSVMTADEPYRLDRAAHAYPAFPGQRMTVARYPGLASVSATSSGGYVDTLGPIHPEQGPYSALDSDGPTAWVSAPFTNPTHQSLTVTLHHPTTLGPVPVQLWSSPGEPRVTSLRVSTDTGSVTVSVDPATRVATVVLPVGATRTLTFSIAGVASLVGARQVGIADIHLPGVDASRTLVLPGAAGPATTMVFGSSPPVRACIYPDRLCTPDAAAPAEEASAMDRTFHVGEQGVWTLNLQAVARPSLATTQLLAPVSAGYTISASSVLAGDPVAAPAYALDGDPLTSWESATGDPSPRLVVGWPQPRTLSRIQVGLGTQDGVRRPTVVRIRGGGQNRVVSVSPGSFGFFSPLRAKQVTITFHSGRVRHRAALGLPMEVSELLIKGMGPHYAPRPSSVTGEPCGLGPAVFIDGTRHDTEVMGTIGDVLAGSPVAVHLCGGRDVALAPGTHRIRIASTAQFQPVQALLEPTDATTVAPAERPDLRQVRVGSWRGTSRTVTVAAGAASTLWVRENANAGWAASAGGHDLQPLTIDGWAQGWRLPAGGLTVVTLSFRPQHTYAAMLVCGGVLVLLLVGATGLVVVRRLRTPWRPGPHSNWPNRWTRAAGLATVGVAAFLAGVGLIVGALAAFVPGMTQVWVRRAFVVVAVVVATGWQVSVGQLSGGADLVAAIAVGLAIGPARRVAP